MKKPIVISDPFPRTLDLIFTKKKLKELKSKYKVLIAPNKNKRQFYEKFDLDRPLRISTVETPFGEYQFELPNAVNRFKFTLTENTDPPMDAIPMRFGEMPEEGETERSAWLGYEAGRWNIFTRADGGNPTPNVYGKLLESFLQFLERIGYDETGQPQN